MIIVDIPLKLYQNLINCDLSVTSSGFKDAQLI